MGDGQINGGYVPARGGKMMAIKPRKISEEHILIDSWIMISYSKSCF